MTSTPTIVQKNMEGPQHIQNLWRTYNTKARELAEFGKYFEGTTSASSYTRKFRDLSFDRYDNESTHRDLKALCAYWRSQDNISQQDVIEIFRMRPFDELALTCEELEIIERVAETRREKREQFGGQDEKQKRQPPVTPQQLIIKKISKRRLFIILTSLSATFVTLIAILIILSQDQNDSSPVTAVSTQQQDSLTNFEWVPTPTIFVSENLEYTMVYVPSGCFTMGYANGLENERPVNRVCVDSFWLGRTEITNGQFGSPPDFECNRDRADSTGTKPPVNGIGPEYPRNCVTWQQAYDFCHAHGMRLPTEAEWEWAARGPSEFLYPWGNTFESSLAIVRTTSDGPGRMLPAGSLLNGTSWVGALDMAGSLSEFTSSRYLPYPYNASDGREDFTNQGTAAEHNATLRVVRGGSFDDYGGDSHRMTRRIDEYYDFSFNTYGFRCAMDVTTTPTN